MEGRAGHATRPAFSWLVFSPRPDCVRAAAAHERAPPYPSRPAAPSASSGAVRRSRAGERVSPRPWTPGIWPVATATSTPASGVGRRVARPQTTIMPDGSVSRSGDRYEQDRHSIGPEDSLVKPSIGVLD